MEIYWDATLAFEQFMAEADLRPLHKASGTLWSVLFSKLEPLQTLAGGCRADTRCIISPKYEASWVPAHLVLW